MTLTLATLQKLWPHGDSVVKGLMEGIVEAAPTVFPKYGLINNLTIAHAMAQFSEECGAGSEMMEDMNYSAVRLRQVFRDHFTNAQALAYQHQPRLIADRAYGAENGNRPGTDDGWNFRGQGLSQVTGRENYQAVAKKTGLDVLNHPELICEPAHTLECGVADFVNCGCLPWALKDSLVGVSSCLNVGHYTSNINAINGYSMRKSWLGLWKHAMATADTLDAALDDLTNKPPAPIMKDA